MAKGLGKRCKILGKKFSFGGSVSPDNIKMRLDYLEADSFETRLLGFSANVNDPAALVKKALEFELGFETLVYENHAMLAEVSRARMTAINKRLADTVNKAA
jgi:hypothetical protein